MATIVGLVVLLAHGIAISGLLLTERRQPTATLAWLFALIFLPGLGLLSYFLVGTTRYRRIVRRTARVAPRFESVIEKYDVHRKVEGQRKARLEPRTESLVRLSQSLATTPASRGNRAEILVDAAATYRSMNEAIESAKDHVHVEFYVIQPDQTGIDLRDLLVAKAREGVRVRVLTDAVGSSRLPADFWGPLLEVRGEAATWQPVWKVFRRWRRNHRVDFRNHRKIVVVDGKVGFTGGINVGREYLGLDPEVGGWRDTHVRITGPAVLSLQKAFVQDWLAVTDHLIDDERAFPDPVGDDGGECIVQVIDSGPDRPFSPLLYVFVQAIALARERVWITSPYFIPSPTLQDGLITAALRGVDVRILLPTRSDSLIVTLASRTYYQRLLEAGVRIYQYERGFVHAKTMLVDHWVATVGSANMDMRSFHINFEINALIYGRQAVKDLARAYLADLENAAEVSEEQLSGRSYAARLVSAGARLLSPLL